MMRWRDDEIVRVNSCAIGWTGERRGCDMSRCKEDVIEMIDNALISNKISSFCDCRYVSGVKNECTHCQIDRGLRAARTCVVQGTDELDLLKVRFIGVQDAIIDKLKAVLKSDGNGGREVPKDD